MPFHDLIGKLASSVQLSHRIPSNVRSPRHLNDNLHWKCPACKSRVNTRDTQFHLIGCLMSIVRPVVEPMSRFTGLIENLDDSRSVCIQSPDRRRVIRPKTRVVRPTPNIQHPIITQEDCSEMTVTKKVYNHVTASGVGKNSIVQRNLSHLTKRNMIALPSIPSPSFSDSSASSSEKHQSNEVQKNQKRKLKSRRENESLGREGPGTADLSEEVSAMSRLVVRGRKKYSTSTTGSKVDKETKGTAWTNFKSSLVPCSKCGRNFYSYRVATHEKLCNDYRNIQPQQPNPVQHKKSAHKFLPRDQTTAGESGVGSEMSSGEKAEWEEHLKQLKSCSRCQRTFFPHRLKIHEKSCHADPLTSKSTTQTQGQHQVPSSRTFKR